MIAARPAIFALCCAVLGASLEAQVLPSAQRKPALTRKENWGVTLGIDAITAVFRPEHCAIVTPIPMTNDHATTEGPCGDEPAAHSSRGYGVGLNIGVTFLRHILFGGEVWAVGFGGNHTYEATEASGIGSETTNSIAGSVYLGGITSPLGGGRKAGRKVWLGMLLGSSTWTGERTCIECTFEPMRMGRPAFVEPFAMFGGGDKDGGGGFRLAYRHHFGGFDAMHSAITFGLFFAFGRM